MRWPAPPDRWGKITGIIALIALLFGSGGFYAGWKATVSQQAIDHDVLWKHLQETQPVWTSVRAAELVNVKQDEQITALHQSIVDLAEVVRLQSDNFSKMIVLIQQQRHERTYK